MLASLSSALLLLVPALLDANSLAGSRPGRVVLVAATSASNGAASTDSPPVVILTLDAVPEPAGNGTNPRRFEAARAAASDAEDRALADALRAATTIELRGGTWLGWYHAANSHRHEREWVLALRRAHANGALVRASGAAAAWIAPWTPVQRAILDKPAQDPNDTSLDLPVPGLGLFGGPLVGVLAPASPTADRVVERALAYGYRDVLLLAGEAEFTWDPASNSATVRIPPASSGSAGAWAAWIDLGAGKRSRGVVRGARATLFGDGDVYSTRTRALAGGERLLEDPEADAAVARLRGELQGANGAGSRAPDPIARAGGEDSQRIGNVRVSRDEKTLRSAHGGSSGVLLDLEIRTP